MSWNTGGKTTRIFWSSRRKFGRVNARKLPNASIRTAERDHGHGDRDLVFQYGIAPTAPPSPRGNRIATSAPGSKAKPTSDSASIVTFLTWEVSNRAAERRPASNTSGIVRPQPAVLDLVWRSRRIR